jgi:ketosteroid isomerase-like protein
MDAIATVEAFVAAINQGDPAQLSELMTEDHTFVDSGGTVESGRSKMTRGWNEYFQMFPDYRVEIDCILHDGDLVAAFGKARGTYNGKRGLVAANVIEMPAAWKAIVENGKIKFWQVYADWSEGGRIIAEDEQHG